MSLIINHAILHVLNKNEVHYSNNELDIDSDACCAFISKHLKKILNGASAKEAVFSDGSETLAILNSYMDSSISFKEFSVAVCKKMSLLIQENDNITPADMLIVQFDKKGDGYIAILKLNYKECFTHQIARKGDNSHVDNQLINIPSLGAGKIENACIIPYNPMVLRILEKPCEIGGEKINYFSEMYLQCEAEMSKKEAVQIINDVITEINSKYFGGSISLEAKAKAALLEEAIEGEGTISMQGVAQKIFSDNEEVKGGFVALAKSSGLIKDADLGEKYVRQQFLMAKFKAENGIELKFPADIFDDSSIIEFQENEGGSVSIVLKNLRRA